jgi:hypothetical protein
LLTGCGGTLRPQGSCPEKRTGHLVIEAFLTGGGFSFPGDLFDPGRRTAWKRSPCGAGLKTEKKPEKTLGIGRASVDIGIPVAPTDAAHRINYLIRYFLNYRAFR